MRDQYNVGNYKNYPMNDVTTQNDTPMVKSEVNGKYNNSHMGGELEAEDGGDGTNKNGKCGNSRWGKIMYNYALDTSFHGPKQFVEEQPFLLRRLIWLLIFLAGLAIFLMQTTSSIQKYMSYPSTVNVKINYNTSITFPAVTICNSNAFRATKAYERGYYTMISDVYGDPNFRNLSVYQPTPDLQHLYTDNGPSLKDLIVSCTWNTVPCDHKEFTQTMTDYGLCYTFNSGKGVVPVKQAIQTGTNGGLNLKLNIEQYEYMVGPNEGAGLKVLIHHPDDTPLVRDHGLALPPGSHGFIGIKTLAVINLPPKYGKCNDSVQLEYFDDYTISNCYTDCKEAYLREKCKCRDINMPPKDGMPPVCNIDLYNTCMQKTYLEFNTKIKPKCMDDCPIPCNNLLFESAVSYASISNFDLEALLRGDAPKLLSKKYVAARETTQRVNKAIVKEDTSLITQLGSIVKTLTQAFDNIELSLDSGKDMLDSSNKELLEHVDFHYHKGIDNVEYIVEHDFIRGWNVYKERAFHYVTLDFMDFPSSLKSVVTTANESIPINNRTTRQLLFSPIGAMIIGKRRLLERSLEFINKTNIAYNTGDPLLTYRLTYERRYDRSYISLPLLHTGIHEESEIYKELLKGMDKMNQGLDALMQIGQYFVETGEFNNTHFLFAEDRFLAGGRAFNYRIFLYESRVVFPPHNVILQRIAEFERENRTLYQDQTNVEWKLEQFHSILHIFHDEWRNIVNVTKMSQEYLVDLNNKKVPLGEEVTSDKMTEIIRTLTVLFQDIRARERELQDMLTVLNNSYKVIWKSMLTEVSTYGFYDYMYNDTKAFLADNSTNNTDYFMPIFSSMLNINESILRQMTPEDVVQRLNGNFHVIMIPELLKSIDAYFDKLKGDFAISRFIGDSDAAFLSLFESYRKNLQNFMDKNVIDANFFKQNFMTIDVFMQELSYEEITQQKAYGIPQMLSEIGGSMGLFIGGSAISAFEFFDLFIHNGARILLHR